MAVILETLTLKRLLAFAFLLVGILIAFFVIGGKIGEWEVNILVWKYVASWCDILCHLFDCYALLLSGNLHLIRCLLLIDLRNTQRTCPVCAMKYGFFKVSNQHGIRMSRQRIDWITRVPESNTSAYSLNLVWKYTNTRPRALMTRIPRICENCKSFTCLQASNVRA